MNPSGRLCAAWPRSALPSWEARPGRGCSSVTPAAGRATTPPGWGRLCPGPGVCGFDISKLAVKAAAGSYTYIYFAVASSFAIPLGTGSVHLLTDVFSPLAQAEFARVVKPGGFFLYAVPGERHLYGLKEILYEAPYENPHRETAYEGFRFVRREQVRDEISLPDGGGGHGPVRHDPLLLENRRGGRKAPARGRGLPNGDRL